MDIYMNDAKLADLFDMVKQDMMVAVVSSKVGITRSRLKRLLPYDGHLVKAYDLFTFPEVSTGIVKLIDKQLWDMYNPLYQETIENSHLTFYVIEKEEE